MAAAAGKNLPKQIKSLRLQCLPFRAMAETTRFVLAYGGIEYLDEVVYGKYFNSQREKNAYPFDKVPVMTVEYHDSEKRPPLTIAQSGSLARFAAQLAGCYTTPTCEKDPAWQAFNDSIFETGQEMCTVNPTLNCYTGSEHQQMKQMYLGRQFSPNVKFLERQLKDVVCPYLKNNNSDSDVFFGGLNTPSYADLNIFHHIDNAQTLYGEDLLSVLEDRVNSEPSMMEDSEEKFSTGYVQRWMDRMRDERRFGGRFNAYLKKRPKVIAVGTNPGLEDRNGRVVRQKVGEGHLWLKDGLFVDSV